MQTIKGKARDVASFTTSATAGTIQDISVDKDNGALLVHQADLEASKDVVGISPVATQNAVVTTLASSATSATALAANTARIGLHLTNTDANVCYVKFGATASATSFTVRLAADASYHHTAPYIYTGIIDAIWAIDGAGSLIITEVT